MYSRKIKVSKKKTKSEQKGSNWGPRLALYEREREQAGLHKPPPSSSQHHHQFNHQLVVGLAPGSSSSASVSNSATYSHHYGQNKQQLYNHYQHRQQQQPEQQQSSRRSNDDPGHHNSNTVTEAAAVTTGVNGSSDGGSNSYYGFSSAHHHQQQQQQVRRESGIKLSTGSTGGGGGAGSSSNLSKPLSVIIPPPDRFNLSSAVDFGPDRDSSVPSTKTWRSSPDQIDDDVHHHDDDDEEDDHNVNLNGDDMDEETGATYDNRGSSKAAAKTGSNGIPPPPQFHNVKSTSQNSSNNNNRKKTSSSTSSTIYEQQQVANGKYTKSKPQSNNNNKVEPTLGGVSGKLSHYHQQQNQNFKSRSATGVGGGALNKQSMNDKTHNGTVIHQDGEVMSSSSSQCLEKEQEESERTAKSKVNGSTIAALAQLTMVYVPMEAASRNLRNKLRPPPPAPPPPLLLAGKTKSPEQQAIDNLQAQIDETNKNCIGSSHNDNLQNQHHNQHHHQQQQQQQQQHVLYGNKKHNESSQQQNNDVIMMDESKDPDVDSLLESFDSIIFKPKTIMNNSNNGQPSSNSSNTNSKTNNDANLYDNKMKDSAGDKLYTSTTTNNHGGIIPSSRRKQQISESPPPLPPPNGSKPLMKKSGGRPDKNLRFSEQLENFQNSFEKVGKQPRLGKKVSVPTTPPEIIHQHHHHNQQDTQSISTDVVDLKKCHNNGGSGHGHGHNGHNSSEQSFHSTILSCGHMRTSSSYSTLSSITSTLTGDDDEEGCDERENCGRRHRDPRTALEQLRDLSLLIGGNFSSSTPNLNGNHDDDAHKKNKKNKILKKDPTTTNIKKTRRDSEGSSGIDSGQGSGQSPTDDSPTHQGKSNGSYQSSCAFSSKGEECEDHCFLTVFKNPLVADSNSSSHSGSCHSTSPAQSDHHHQHHHHRHLIIHDQSGRSSSKQSSALAKNRATGSSNSSLQLLGNNNKLHNGSKKSSKKSKKSKKSHHHDDLVLEYCDCSQCDCEVRRDSMAAAAAAAGAGAGDPISSTKIKSGDSNELMSTVNGNHSNNNHHHHHGSDNSNSGGANNNHNHSNRPTKTITTSSSGSSSAAAAENHHHSQLQQQHNGGNNNNNGNNLFTIDEEEVGEVVAGGGGGTDLDFKTITTATNPSNTFMDVTIKEFNNDEGKDHWHPKCWLASDPNMGWSDLESLYSQNLKLEKPMNINDECWTCWKDVAENRRNATDPNRTVDRTKRMFIWLNKRHQEFNAPWWEAKKQASIRWLVTKAFAHLPKEQIGDPFKESKKGKPKYRLKDEVIKGLVNGKLYCLALDHLYQNQHYRSRGLTHWDIIKILSRKNIYVAQPSDMKLTEGTLRQKKPLRIAAHVALMEAIMGLYCKEILNRDRIVATLNSFGHKIDPETNASAEQLLISWINAAMLTLKSYILSNKNQNQKLPCGRLNRWLNIPQVHEIRDLCDGVGICSLFALYCSNDLQVAEIAVPETDEMLNIYETIANHSLIEKLCTELFQETVYHFCITDFLYIHGYMKQNILAFLVDLFNHLEINPIVRVNRLTHVPIRIEL